MTTSGCNALSCGLWLILEWEYGITNGLFDEWVVKVELRVPCKSPIWIKSGTWINWYEGNTCKKVD